MGDLRLGEARHCRTLAKSAYLAFGWLYFAIAVLLRFILRHKFTTPGLAVEFAAFVIHLCASGNPYESSGLQATILLSARHLFARYILNLGKGSYRGNERHHQGQVRDPCLG